MVIVAAMFTASSASAAGAARPEAMADVPGVCELPLTRAVVQYRDVHELDHPGGRIQDIGLAVVVEGRFASSVRAIDLGSAETKFLDLSSELVVLDWLYEPTLAHVRRLADAASEDRPPGTGLGPYCFDLALRVLARRGFTPLTRSTLLRIGYRDLCQDLDLHEGTAVRITTRPGKLVRVHLEYDAAALVFETSPARRDHVLESALREVFPGLPAARFGVGERGGGGAEARRRGYRVRFGVPLDFGEARRSLYRMRHGLSHLVARFEPERFRALDSLVSTFGERRTLDRLRFPAVADMGLGASIH